MYRSGLGWRSFDPREAVSAVHEIENPAALRQVIFEARNPEARRLALIKLGDKALMGSFALSDPSPIVRRRMARALDDPAVLEKILEEDDDRSVRDAAGSRLDQLEKEKAAEIEKAAEEAKEQQEDSPDILERKKKEAVVQAAIEYITKLFADSPGSHDADHTLRVYHNALAIADSLKQCDRWVVSLAAILHDTDDHKLFQTENNENARAFMTQQKIDADTADRICRIINEVSFSRNRGRRPSSLEGMIVQDADRLDAMGAVGIARTFAFGGEQGRPLQSSIDHFYEKLLLLRSEMNTHAGRCMAAERHTFMEAFLEEYKKEMWFLRQGNEEETPCSK